MPTVSFNLDDHMYTIPPSGYCTDLVFSYGMEPTFYLSGPGEQSLSAVVLGLPWFRAYYTAFYYDDAKVKFGVNAYSPFAT
jgi:hypothetical protein